MSVIRWRWRSLAWGVAIAATLAIAIWIAFLRPARTLVGATMAPQLEVGDAGAGAIAIRLRKIAEGMSEPTDIQFPPGDRRYGVVLQKGGSARWLDLERGAHGTWFDVAVRNVSEEGLLGLAFHPRFAHNGRFFINYVTTRGSQDISRVAEWRITGPPRDLPRTRASEFRVLMEVDQPYPNHNAGQLAFGPDGYLYIGWGDGGAANDPHNHGQDGRTWLGSMLRIDVDSELAPDAGRAYAIPRDNPFLDNADFAPETWAYGLRNPWRYSFDPDGRLIVADVGQSRWEEIDIVQAGDNLGWNIREGFECFRSDRSACEREDLVVPVVAYGRDLGGSITGGYVYTGSAIPALHGLYVFADFLSGRLFAMTLPADRKRPVHRPMSLGRWRIMPATFGRDARGELYVADFSSGDIFRIDASARGASQPSQR